MLRAGVDRLPQKAPADRDIALLDRAERERVQQLRAFDLGHRDDGQVVIPLRGAREDEVVLGREQIRVVGYGFAEQPLGLAEVSA
jgi:hypothetical protein